MFNDSSCEGRSDAAVHMSALSIVIRMETLACNLRKEKDTPDLQDLPVIEEAKSVSWYAEASSRPRVSLSNSKNILLGYITQSDR